MGNDYTLGELSKISRHLESLCTSVGIPDYDLKNYTTPLQNVLRATIPQERDLLGQIMSAVCFAHERSNQPELARLEQLVKDLYQAIYPKESIAIVWNGKRIYAFPKCRFSECPILSNRIFPMAGAAPQPFFSEQNEERTVRFTAKNLILGYFETGQDPAEILLKLKLYDDPQDLRELGILIDRLGLEELRETFNNTRSGDKYLPKLLELACKENNLSTFSILIRERLAKTKELGIAVTFVDTMGRYLDKLLEECRDLDAVSLVLPATCTELPLFAHLIGRRVLEIDPHYLSKIRQEKPDTFYNDPLFILVHGVFTEDLTYYPVPESGSSRESLEYELDKGKALALIKFVKGIIGLSQSPDSEKEWPTLVPQILGRIKSFRDKELLREALSLSVIPPEIWYMVNLQRVNFAGNHLKRVPPELWMLPKLQFVDLGHNEILGPLVGVEAAQQLKVLELSCNRLKEFPLETNQLPKLKYLGIAGNPFNK